MRFQPHVAAEIPPSTVDGVPRAAGGPLAGGAGGVHAARGVRVGLPGCGEDHRQDRGELPAHLRPRFDLVFASRSHATKSGPTRRRDRARPAAGAGWIQSRWTTGRSLGYPQCLRQQAGLTIKRFQIPAHLGEVGRIGLQHTVDDGTGHHVDQHVQVGVGPDRSLLSRPLQ